MSNKKFDRAKFSSEYTAWCSMKSRCYNANYSAYKNYGELGVKVCDEWVDSFDSFMEYMGKKPYKEFTLERIDPFGNYEPGNVKWASWEEQAKNKRRKKLEKQKKIFDKHQTTTFQLSVALHEQLKLMCMLTKKTMGEFIRLAIIDKIKEVKVGNPDGK